MTVAPIALSFMQPLVVCERRGLVALANTAVVYDRSINSQTLNFEASGALLSASLVMRDRETDSWWSIMSSKAIGGELDGVQLTELPVGEKVTWRNWSARHPATLVLSVDGVEHVDSNPYDNYFASEQTFRDLEIEDQRLEPGEPGQDHSKRKLNPDFVLNQPRYRGAQVLLGRENFGCGSSREHAVWALADYGFRVVIAPSFADIFYNNCFKNGILPIELDAAVVERLFQEMYANEGYELTVDLEQQVVRTPSGEEIAFEVDAFRRHCLLNGLDDIGLTLESADAGGVLHDLGFLPRALDTLSRKNQDELVSAVANGVIGWSGRAL